MKSSIFIARLCIAKVRMNNVTRGLIETFKNELNFSWIQNKNEHKAENKNTRKQL